MLRRFLHFLFFSEHWRWLHIDRWSSKIWRVAEHAARSDSVWLAAEQHVNRTHYHVNGLTSPFNIFMGIVGWIDLIWKETLPVEPAGTSGCCSSLKECVFLMFADLLTDAIYRPRPFPNWPRTSMDGHNSEKIWRKFSRVKQPQHEPTWWSRSSCVPGGNLHPGDETSDPSPWHFSIPHC